MDKFERAYYHPTTWQELVGMPGVPDEAAARAIHADMLDDIVYKNDVYQVAMRFKIKSGITHLSIKRVDREPIHNWRDLQHIKNELCGVEREAVEIYPAESRRVDSANQYHLWVLPPGECVPFGFSDRLVVDGELPVGNAKQRPLDKHDHSKGKT